MPPRLVALDEGADISLDRAMIVVGRHPQCDARLDSLRVSRHHCCMTRDSDDVLVRDLGSTNGVRINGHRVEVGRLRPGDELSIAHIRYRLEGANGHEQTLADGSYLGRGAPRAMDLDAPHPAAGAIGDQIPPENRLAAAVRDLLPASMADRCRIQVIVQVPGEPPPPAPTPDPASEDRVACPPDSSR